MKFNALRRILIVLAFCMTGIFSGCQVSMFEGVRLNQKAQVYYEYGQYDEAIEMLSDSLDSDYENSASHYWLGRCFEAQGNLTKAIYEYELAVRFGPSLDIAQMALITSLHQDQQEEKSLQATKRYLEHKEVMTWEFFRIADEFREQSMNGHAALTYQYAQQVEPTNPEPSLRQADLYFDQGEKEKGVDSLIQAFKIDPVYPGLARRLGEYRYRVDIPQPQPPAPPTPLERELKEMY